jgi:hypothetical protein
MEGRMIRFAMAVSFCVAAFNVAQTGEALAWVMKATGSFRSLPGHSLNRTFGSA